ncbi:hypothetical protein BN134_1867 [Cronobacter dublinensis 1210]|uniref:Uncharacterized protein n=1 Tax=Cronobacter dublinensis 1210 TaxID=1208656 RepID=A0ABP1W987_9ENTR|nr:hypothetical protein BN134_1867 [Cronobacter dublinensis 1210]CCJ87960.1 hypothetical protein BN133_4337 [Cronobacter dublinensis 582]
MHAEGCFCHSPGWRSVGIAANVVVLSGAVNVQNLTKKLYLNGHNM